MSLDFTGQVAIITGAGNGLGKNHAIALAKRGAHVVINDMGGNRDGSGRDSTVAEAVCEEIRGFGGSAIPHSGSVTDVESVETMTDLAMTTWGRIDVLVNNAGILRDKTFAKMSLDDFKQVLDVHLMGSVNCCHSVYPHMQQQQYGRIVVTTSSSGLYGNFGQTNYGAAKLGLVGFMNCLGLESQKYNIHINALAPIANTRMTADIIPQNIATALDQDSVTAGLLPLCSQAAPNRKILAAGAGYYATSQLMESDGSAIDNAFEHPEQLLEQWQTLSQPYQGSNINSGPEQTMKFIKRI